MNIIDQVKQTLIEEIEVSIRKANLAEDIPEIKIEIPKDPKNGDYSSNIAMVLTKIAKRNPREIAQAIVDHLDTSKAHMLNKLILLGQVSSTFIWIINI